MTALEKLIKLTSTDASALYRETADQAKCELQIILESQKRLNENLEELNAMLVDVITKSGSGLL